MLGIRLFVCSLDSVSMVDGGTSRLRLYERLTKQTNLYSVGTRQAKEIDVPGCNFAPLLRIRVSN